MTSPASAPPEAGPARVEVDASVPGRAVSPLLFGLNHRFCYDAFGTYDPGSGRVDPGFVAALRRTGVAVLRFPGGTVANTYRWRHGVGAPGRRARVPHGRTGEPLATAYGIDEHARLCAELGVPTTVVVNMATGTAAEAAAWVEYCNAPDDGSSALAAERAARGHPEPYGVRYWEVANEPHLPTQRYWLGAGSPDEVAHRYAFGGTTLLPDEPVGTPSDHRDAAADSPGEAHWCRTVRYPPVVPGSLAVRVDGRVWQPVDDLTACGAEDVYAVDPATGALRFGDGRHGNVPPRGARVTATYESGPHEGFVHFARAMKAVDPTVRVCTSLESERLVDLLGDEHPYDGYVVHQYSGPAFRPEADPRNGDPDAVHDVMMAQPEVMGAALDRVRARIDARAGARAGEVELLLTEYGMLALPFDHRLPAPRYLASLDQALYVACSLAEYAERGVAVALKHTAVDVAPDDGTLPGAGSLGPADQAVLGPPPDYLPSATARVLALLSGAVGSRLAGCTVAGGPTRRLADGRELRALRTLATTDDAGTVHLWVVNRDREAAVPARVAVAGTRPGARGEVWVLTGDGPTAVVTAGRPEAVSVTGSVVEVPADGLALTFPPCSVTTVSLPAAGAGGAGGRR